MAENAQVQTAIKRVLDRDRDALVERLNILRRCRAEVQADIDLFFAAKQRKLVTSEPGMASAGGPANPHDLATDAPGSVESGDPNGS